jgi:hypothetical protein
MKWHIAKLPKTSTKACFAQQAITKKKCEAKIVQGNKPTAIPTYTCVIQNAHKKRPEVKEFFRNDDIERYVKGTKQKWVQSRPNIPSIWPVKIETSLSKKKILDLESVGFQLPQPAVISPRRLFGMDELPFHLASFPTPASANEIPKSRSGKCILKNNNAPSTKQANNYASSLTLKGQIHKVKMIPHPGYGCIVILDSGTLPKVQQYLITIGTFPECSCKYFKDMASKSLDKHGGWASCKHLYFVFTVIGSLKSERDAFIHAALSMGRAAYPGMSKQTSYGKIYRPDVHAHPRLPRGRDFTRKWILPSALVKIHPHGHTHSLPSLPLPPSFRTQSTVRADARKKIYIYFFYFILFFKFLVVVAVLKR